MVCNSAYFREKFFNDFLWIFATKYEQNLEKNTIWSMNLAEKLQKENLFCSSGNYFVINHENLRNEFRDIFEIFMNFNDFSENIS